MTSAETAEFVNDLITKIKESFPGASIDTCLKFIQESVSKQIVILKDEIWEDKD